MALAPTCGQLLFRSSMKHALALIAAILALPVAANAQQRIETLIKTGTDTDAFYQVSPSELVEVLSVVPHGDFSNGTVYVRWPGNKTTLIRPTAGRTVVLKGINGIRIERPNNGDEVSALTIRITPEGTTPLVSEPVVVPVTEGPATLSIEASTDLQNWFPAGEGEIPADSPARFFRLKVAVTR